MIIVNHDMTYPLFCYFTAEQLELILQSFYSVREGFRNTRLYIFGQGHGAQLAVALAARLHQVSYMISSNKLTKSQVDV